tara:strand:- start:2847 stop:3254 length:408 start_codon:yes stop_codon:yes gene_type:complete
MKSLLATWIIILSILIVPFAMSQNEYLNGGSHCSSHRLEPYMEYRLNENIYDNSSGSNNRGNNGTIGMRYSFSFGGTCTTEYKSIMLENERLKQELEMLKVCSKYKDLELGKEFATVREKCKGVNKKTLSESTNK